MKSKFRKYFTGVNGKSLGPLGKCIHPKDAPPDIDVGFTNESLFTKEHIREVMKAFRSPVKWPVEVHIPITREKVDLANRKLIDGFGREIIQAGNRPGKRYRQAVMLQEQKKGKKTCKKN